MRKEYNAFSNQRKRAKARGISFEFEFEEWCCWWKFYLGDDWLSKRGRLFNQYVMARKNDSGPYKAGNVECITQAQNSRDKARPLPGYSGPPRSGYRKLKPAEALAIYETVGTQRSIAALFGVSERLVRMIKHGQIWVHITSAKGSSR